MPERERRCYQGCPEILCDDLRTSLISRRNNRREKFFWELFPIIKKVYGKCINHMV